MGFLLVNDAGRVVRTDLDTDLRGSPKLVGLSASLAVVDWKGYNDGRTYNQACTCTYHVTGIREVETTYGSCLKIYVAGYLRVPRRKRHVRRDIVTGRWKQWTGHRWDQVANGAAREG